MRAKRTASVFGALAAAGAGVVVGAGSAQAAPYVPCPPQLRATSLDAGALPPWLQDCVPPPTGIVFHRPHRHHHGHGHHEHGRHRRITHVLIDEPARPSSHTALPDTGAEAAVAIGVIGTTLLSVGGLITAGRHRRPRW
ncbi:MAG TPA: LPXTG cell wall anchor domain-containing protein [Sporichthyaceae bacterium]|jgi:LPXTG-motif cell wall-anchored protein